MVQVRFLFPEIPVNVMLNLKRRRTAMPPSLSIFSGYKGPAFGAGVVSGTTAAAATPGIDGCYYPTTTGSPIVIGPREAQ